MQAEDSVVQEVRADGARALPAPLSALTELACDLRWACTEDVAALFRALDEETWFATHNPYAVLQTAGAERLQELARTPGFVLALRALEERRRDRGLRARERSDRTLRGHLIAYFSMEFGLAPGLPIYAGGLGVLAGDLLKAASDRGLPLVAVGMLFQQGHFAQVLRNTRQEESYPLNEPSQMPIRALRAPDGALVRVPLQIAGRRVWLRVWLAQVGDLELYLLDSNDPANRATDRCITQQLYIGAPETRLLQEIVLGVGGYRLLDMLGLRPSILHINEGHAAFAALERTRIFARDEACTFQEALWATRAGNVFTTHTSLAAGFDRFAPELITGALLGPAGALSDLELSPATLLCLGRDQQADGYFNMACLAVRCSGFANAVSRSHCRESRTLFAGLLSQHDVKAHGCAREQHAEEPAISYVTNGVDVTSWVGSMSDRLWRDNHHVERWLEPSAQAQMTDERLWQMRCTQRAQLVTYAARRSQNDSSSLPAPSLTLRPDVLTLGFARRFTGYKRPDLLLRNPERLVTLLTSSERPVQIVIAGKAHPADLEGKKLLTKWLRFSQRARLASRVVFLEDYDLACAARLVRGVDVWINTPRPPFEACGTSGMKVLANGGLNLSSRDGWWSEVDDPTLGFSIGDKREPDDELDAEELYSRLEHEIVPCFYERDASGLPRRWLACVRRSMLALTWRFSAQRMVGDYVDRIYLPAALAYALRVEDNSRLARELAAAKAQPGAKLLAAMLPLERQRFSKAEP